MSFLQKDPQYKLRLPADLKEKIEKSAQEKNRSMNADIVARLQDSFDVDIHSINNVLKAIEELVNKNIHSTRKLEVADRLNFLKNTFSQLNKDLSSSIIALKIEEEYVEHVDLWFKAKLEPSFSQLRRVAQLFNCDTNWLFHGLGKPFAVVEDIFPTDLTEAIEWLNKSHQLYGEPLKIFLVCQQDNASDLYIVKFYEFNRFEIFLIKNISLDYQIDGQKFKNLQDFTNCLKQISKNHELASLKKKIKSFVLKCEDFELLLSGQSHPLSVLTTYIPWWEDIWDESFYHNNQYWNGWIEVCNKIHEK